MVCRIKDESLALVREQVTAAVDSALAIIRLLDKYPGISPRKIARGLRVDRRTIESLYEYFDAVEQLAGQIDELVQWFFRNGVLREIWKFSLGEPLSPEDLILFLALHRKPSRKIAAPPPDPAGSPPPDPRAAGGLAG